MRPGHSVAFGTTSRGVIFGLPGNPVSSMVCFEQLVIPALRRMMGHTRLYRRTLEAQLAHPVRIRPGRTDFIRVQLERSQGGSYVARSTGNQSSGALLSMAQADALLVVPATSTGLETGEQGVVQLLDGTSYQDQAGFEEQV